MRLAARANLMRGPGRNEALDVARGSATICRSAFGAKTFYMETG